MSGGVVPALRVPAFPLLLLAVILTVMGVARPASASCLTEAGAARAELYVRECLAITTATHPPCNVENSCTEIGTHIQEMCANDPNRPGWCQAYARTPVPNPPPPMPATHPGFDCAKAASPVDREICAGGNDSIADDDRVMAALYRKLAARGAGGDTLRVDQRNFLRERQACAEPEPGRQEAGLALDHCIGTLTHERLVALKRLSGQAGPLWSASGAPDCTLSFGEDGWDRLSFASRSGRLVFTGADMRDQVLRPGDKADFEIGTATVMARLEPDEDGSLTAVATGPQLAGALAKGTMVRVRRNGKVILRVPLADFAAAAAHPPGTCRPER